MIQLIKRSSFVEMCSLMKMEHGTGTSSLKFYGLKQAPRAWNSRIDQYFIKIDFTKCPYEHALYMKMSGECDLLLVCLYVNDLIFTGNNLMMFEDFKLSMMREFEMI